MNLDFAMHFSRTAHGAQTDLAGAPYWRHPVRVMERLGDSATLAEKITALLHDILEDTPVTLDDLRLAGFSDEVVEAVRLLTHTDPTMTYTEYIRGLAASGNRTAIRVKLADLADNLDPSRPRPDSLTKRYEAALEMLRGHLDT